MKWIVIVTLTIAAVVSVAVLIGSRLPRAHRASREQDLPAPPEVVWAALTEVEAFPTWRSDVKKVQMLPDRDGQRVWIEEGKQGKMTFRVERSEPPRLLVTRIADPDLPFGGTWTYVIAPVPGGSRLTITEDGEIYNPLFRLVARFVLGYEGTIASYLGALQKRFSGAPIRR
jgi:uncharacterized protein YndB with AHSA1/START domain